MIRLAVALPLALALLVADPARVRAQPFLPTDRAAVDLVAGRRTAAHTTVARTLAIAERASGGVFARAGYRIARGPDEPSVRVLICYRLGAGPRTCDLEYRVTVDPPHVEPADRFVGLGRDLEHGPRAFVRALAREETLQRRPEMLRRVEAVLDPRNPYDWR